MIQFKCRQWLVLWSILAASFFSCFVVSSVNAAEGTALGIEISGHRYRNLDDVFVFPTGGRHFDSELWKREPSSRFAMLFDLYHQPLNKKTPEQIYELLGAPSELKVEHSGSQSAYYDLGLQNGLPTFLAVFFGYGQQGNFHIQQRAQAGLSSKRYCSDWLLENLTWTTVAKEYNQQFLLVGMPVWCLPRVFGCNSADIVAGGTAPGSDDSLAKSSSDGNLYRLGSLEFEYSADKLSVKRFRFHLPEGGVTDWEAQDLRTDHRSGNRETEVSYLFFRSSPLLDFRPFNLKIWNAILKDNRNIGIRRYIVGSLLRTYPIIGMTRSQIRKLFGPCARWLEADKCFSDPQQKSKTEEHAPDSLSADVEDHLLSLNFDYLELSFKDDRVVAYRYIYLPKAGCVIDLNQDKFSNGFFFEFRENG